MGPSPSLTRFHSRILCIQHCVLCVVCTHCASVQGRGYNNLNRISNLCNMSRRRSVSKFVLASRDQHDSEISKAASKTSKQVDNSIKDHTTNNEEDNNNDHDRYRVFSKEPSFRVFDSEPSYRVLNQEPHTTVYGQHQETPNIKILQKRRHGRTNSTNAATTTDPRIANYRRKKATIELERANQYQNFVSRRRYYGGTTNQTIRLIPNRAPPPKPT